MREVNDVQYSNDTRVRIRGGGGFRDPFSDIWQYENLTGKVLSSNLADDESRLVEWMKLVQENARAIFADYGQQGYSASHRTSMAIVFVCRIEPR